MRIVSESKYKLTDLAEMFRKQEIEIPSFQRGLVWKDLQRSKFMDTVFSNFYIMPIFIFIVNGIMYLIDGQQRITTIVAWESGDIRLPMHSRYVVQGFDRRQNRSYQEVMGIPAAIEHYLSRTVTVVILEGNEMEAMEQYRTVNLGAGMTLGELYRSTKSHAVDVAMRFVSKHDFFVNNIKYTKSRSGHIVLALRTLLNTMVDEPISLGEGNINALVDKYTDWGGGNMDVLREAESSMSDTLTQMGKLFPFLRSDNGMFRAASKISATYWLCKTRKYDPEPMADFLNRLDEGLANNSRKKAQADPVLAEINSCFRDATAQQVTVYKLFTMFQRLWDKFAANGYTELIINPDDLSDLLPMKKTRY